MLLTMYTSNYQTDYTSEIKTYFESFSFIFGFLEESLLKETPNKGHCIKYLSTMDKTKSPNFNPPIANMQLESLKRGQSLYSGQTTSIYSGPKVSFIRRLHCNIKSCTFVAGILRASYGTYLTERGDGCLRSTVMC